MKTKSFIKSLGILGATAVMALTEANAKPDKDPGVNDHPSSQKEVKSNGNSKAESGAKDKHPAKGKGGDKDRQSAQREEHRGKSPKKDAKNSLDRKGYKRDEGRQELARGRFEKRDRDEVVSYFSQYQGRANGLPPGLARKWESGRRLPPGWRDRVVTGYVIEDDWFPAFEPVPYGWFPGMAVVPDTRLYWYGDRVVRVYEPSREVVDVVVVPSIHIDL